MAKCTGMRCPIQVGYKIEECNHTDCPYRTEPMTNADRIRSMSDEGLAVFLDGFSSRCLDCAEDAKNQSCPIYKEAIIVDHKKSWNGSNSQRRRINDVKAD